LRAGRLRHVQRGPRVRRLAANIQEQRSLFGERPRRKPDPVACPLEILRPRHPVVVGAVADAEVVRGRRDDRIERSLGEPCKDVEAVAQVEPERRAADFEGGMGLWETNHRRDCRLGGTRKNAKNRKAPIFGTSWTSRLKSHETRTEANCSEADAAARSAAIVWFRR